MKDKLRELAARWNNARTASENPFFVLNSCAAELLAILDAEGDGGAVSDALNVIERWGQRGNTLDGDDVDRFRALADKIAPTAARSGVVSDEEVEAAKVGGWADAYAAFKGAFDTPAAWLKDNSEYANDARKRLREFNEAMLAAAPSAPEGGEVAL